MLTQEVQKVLALGMHQVYEIGAGYLLAQNRIACVPQGGNDGPLTSWFPSQFLSVSPR